MFSHPKKKGDMYPFIQWVVRTANQINSTQRSQQVRDRTRENAVRVGIHWLPREPQETSAESLRIRRSFPGRRGSRTMLMGQTESALLTAWLPEYRMEGRVAQGPRQGKRAGASTCGPLPPVLVLTCGEDTAVPQGAAVGGRSCRWGMDLDYKAARLSVEARGPRQWAGFLVLQVSSCVAPDKLFSLFLNFLVSNLG